MKLSIGEEFLKKKLSISKRIYIWTSIVICIITIIVILFSSLNAIRLNQLEYEKDLYAITGQLGNHLNQSFDDILRLKGAVDKPSEEQLLILNSALQPIVNLIGQEYPKFALGFFSAKLDRNVAVVPNKGVDKLVPVPHDRPFFKVYETRQPMLTKVYASSIWGIPTLSYTNPIFDQNGVMIGHAWANITLREMYKGLLINSVEILGIGLTALALVLLILKKLSDRLNKEINDLATAIVSNDTEIKEYLLPELKPVIKKIRDHITEIKDMQNRVSFSDERFSKAFNASPHMMSIIRRSNCKYIDVNQRFLVNRGFSREDVIGKTPTDIGVVEGELQAVLNLVEQNGIVENLEVSMATKDGLKGTILLSGDKIILDNEECILLAYNDITEMKQLQAEMARLDRLNLVGQMAAGIAHEIRNPLTTVRGYLQLLGAKSELQSHASTFELMIEELDRANSIISEFLSIVRNRPTERECQNINEILQHLYPLLEADTFTQNKQIVFEAGETPDILLNAKEISQLVLNLCRNGLEAMQVGGTLTIRTYIEDENVVFCVEDEGCGIHSESLDKIGTPFFTTKDNGTGLGLVTCYSIADRHNATIDLKSGSGGTAFFVRFPCIAVNQ